MERFTLRVDMDNDAFTDTPASALARILRNVAQQVSNGQAHGNIWDDNGNSVGSFQINGKRAKGDAS